MPEIKHLFSSGRMNKDLDERLVPNGEYRDALNIQLASSEGSNVGAIQNILGNLQINSNLAFSNPKFKCYAVDYSDEKIYWFVKDDLASYLLVYDGTEVSIVIKDVNNVVFNFNDELITGVKFFEGYIALTDNIGEPKLIDVNLFQDENQARLSPATTHSQLYNATTDTWYDITADDITLIKKKPGSAPTLILNSSGGVEDADPLFELKFVRFAYRWKFKNGQYSIFSPFSESAFLPGVFEFNAKKGYNTGMENTVKSITIEGIDYSDNDIDSIDILMKKSDDQSVYTVETLQIADVTGSYELTSEQIYSVVSSNQLLRLWDAVPLKAKALEVSSNRLIFGNYEIGENTKNIKPAFNIELTARGTNRKHIKSDRTYQFGLVFEDKYGRQTPILSNKSGSINVPFGNRDHMNAPQQFTVSMTDILPEEATSSFDKFKYFIKDTSGEYYNVVAESIFPNPEKLNSTEVWMSMPSTEINKFKEGDFLHLKKGQQSSIPIANPKAKFKTLSVESSAPDFIGVAPTDPAAVSAITNFDYENYNTAGRFFVKLEDIDGILSSLYQANVANNAVEELIPEASFGTASYPSGSFLGEWRTYDSGGGYIEKNFYFSESSTSPGSGNVAVFTQTGYGTGTAFSNPQGTLVTEDITFGSVTVDGTNTNYKWYDAGTTTYLDGFTRTIYCKWTPAESQGVTYYQLNSVAILPLVGEDIETIDPAVFETEPAEGFLDIYYETEEAFPIAEYGNIHNLRYFNCYNFQNGVESNRIRDDFNAPYIDKQVRVSTAISEQYKRNRNTQGLIWSGIFNSRSSVNRLNQFLTAEPITKDLNPEYGSIQLLHTRDTDVIAFCEDKVLNILANKDALYNADGSTNITASNAVLGQAVPYKGEFGISKNPESFASYGYQAYFTDKARGVVLRLSLDGLTVISAKSMTTYFRDKLKLHSGSIIGSYDIHTRQYVISFKNDESIGFSEAVDGWTSRFSFVADSGLFLEGKYFTFKNGQLWQHNADGINKFYNIQSNSFVKFIFNDQPSVVKKFKTIGYEGTQGNTLDLKGWKATSIETDLQSGKVTYFKGKEGKWFNNIEGIQTSLPNLDPKEFSIQGLGSRSGEIVIPPDPYVEIAGDTTKDVNNNLTLSAFPYNFSGTPTYSWSGGSATGLTSPTIEINEPIAGTYTYTITATDSGNGQTYVDTIEIVWTGVKQYTVTLSDIVYNITGLQEFTATGNVVNDIVEGPEGGEWSFDSSIVANSGYNLTGLSITNNSGIISGDESIVITISGDIQAGASVTASGPTSGNIGQNITLTATPDSFTGTASYVWHGGAAEGLTGSSISFTETSTGNVTYYVVATDSANGAEYTSNNVSVAWATNGSVSITGPTSGNTSSSVTLTANPSNFVGAATYLWSGGNVTGQTGSSVTVTSGSEGNVNYSVTATDTVSGETYTDSHIVNWTTVQTGTVTIGAINYTITGGGSSQYTATGAAVGASVTDELGATYNFSSSISASSGFYITSINRTGHTGTITSTGNTNITINITANIEAVPQAVVTITGNTSAETGSSLALFASASGFVGTPYNFIWSGGNAAGKTTQSITVSEATDGNYTYSVSVTDSGTGNVYQDSETVSWSTSVAPDQTLNRSISIADFDNNSTINGGAGLSIGSATYNNTFSEYDQYYSQSFSFSNAILVSYAAGEDFTINAVSASDQYGNSYNVSQSLVPGTGIYLTISGTYPSQVPAGGTANIDLDITASAVATLTTSITINDNDPNTSRSIQANTSTSYPASRTDSGYEGGFLTPSGQDGDAYQYTITYTVDPGYEFIGQIGGFSQSPSAPGISEITGINQTTTTAQVRITGTIGNTDETSTISYDVSPVATPATSATIRYRFGSSGTWSSIPSGGINVGEGQLIQFEVTPNGGYYVGAASNNVINSINPIQVYAGGVTIHDVVTKTGLSGGGLAVDTFRVYPWGTTTSIASARLNFLDQ